jgi:hypothetical protein
MAVTLLPRGPLGELSSGDSCKFGVGSRAPACVLGVRRAADLP